MAHKQEPHPTPQGIRVMQPETLRERRQRMAEEEKEWEARSGPVEVRRRDDNGSST